MTRHEQFCLAHTGVKRKLLEAEITRLREELAGEIKRCDRYESIIDTQGDSLAKLRAVVEAAKAARPEDWMDLPSIHRLIDLYKALDALEVPK